MRLGSIPGSLYPAPGALYFHLSYPSYPSVSLKLLFHICLPVALPHFSPLVTLDIMQVSCGSQGLFKLSIKGERVPDNNLVSRRDRPSCFFMTFYVCVCMYIYTQLCLYVYIFLSLSRSLSLFVFLSLLSLTFSRPGGIPQKHLTKPSPFPKRDRVPVVFYFYIYVHTHTQVSWGPHGLFKIDHSRERVPEKESYSSLTVLSLLRHVWNSWPIKNLRLHYITLLNPYRVGHGCNRERA